MTPPPVVLTETEIRAMLPVADAVELVRDALITAERARPWRLDLPGLDVAVGGAHPRGAVHFTARLASPSTGLSVVGDAATGRPAVIALDDGYLGDVRTAAAGALATDALADPDARTVAVVGGGPLAALHLEALATLREVREIRVSGRGLRDADIVAVHAATPRVHGGWLKPGVHITALGEGHLALTGSVLNTAELLVADDPSRGPAGSVPLGPLLAGQLHRPDGRPTVAAITGAGAADAALGAHIAGITRAITGLRT
ncbi:hypothetical protein [Actinomadura fibrosa]|uniref:Ornithine cyclodeaminase n=1 Tax=Actinomadura fibrosa TaxID=111802 RepID=A0ABW2XEG1_9ACTN|nr:hypothetical protein [Actinomadura fibrosa]